MVADPYDGDVSALAESVVESNPQPDKSAVQLALSGQTTDDIASLFGLRGVIDWLNSGPNPTWRWIGAGAAVITGSTILSIVGLILLTNFIMYVITWRTYIDRR